MSQLYTPFLGFSTEVTTVEQPTGRSNWWWKQMERWRKWKPKLCGRPVTPVGTLTSPTSQLVPPALWAGWPGVTGPPGWGPSTGTIQPHRHLQSPRTNLPPCLWERKKQQHLSLKTRVESGTGSLRVYLEKKTVRDRKDNSPSPELILAEITPAGTQSQTIRLKGTLLIEWLHELKLKMYYKNCFYIQYIFSYPSVLSSLEIFTKEM